MRLCLNELRPLVKPCACASVRASRVRYPVHLCGPVPLFGTFNIWIDTYYSATASEFVPDCTVAEDQVIYTLVVS